MEYRNRLRPIYRIDINLDSYREEEPECDHAVILWSLLS